MATNQSLEQTVDEIFDTLVKSRFIEMFGDIHNPKYGLCPIDSISVEILAGGDKPSNISDTVVDDCIYPVFANATENKGLMGYTNTYRVGSKAVTISARGAIIGYCEIREACFTPVVRLIAIVPSSDMNLNFLKYMLEQLDLKPSGSGQPQLIVPDLRRYMIIKPPINLQDEFESFVQLIDKSKVICKQMVSKFDDLVKSRFIEMFGDPIRNEKRLPSKLLKDCCSKITNGTTPKGGSQVYVDSGILFLRSQNVWRNRFDMEDVAYIDQKTHNSMKESSLKHKDILITKTGRFNTDNSSLGRAALYLGDDDAANINGHVYLVRIDKEVIPEFVLQILISDSYRDYIRQVCVGGIDKRQINKEHVEKFPIIIPDVNEQKSFVEFCKQVDKSKSAFINFVANRLKYDSGDC